MSDQLLERIEKLERQNKRMKAAMSVLGLCLGTLLTAAYMVPQKSQSSIDRLEVREIIMSDGGAAAKLTPHSLTFSAKSGFEAEKATISASAISLGGRYAAELKPSGLVCSREGVPRFDLNVGEIGAQVALKNGAGLLGTMMDENTIVLINSGGMLSMRPEHVFIQKGEADTLLAPSSLRIRDSEKNRAILGQADPIAAKTAIYPASSAASLTLLGKDDAVIWQAPQK